MIMFLMALLRGLIFDESEKIEYDADGGLLCWKGGGYYTETRDLNIS